MFGLLHVGESESAGKVQAANPEPKTSRPFANLIRASLLSKLSKPMPRTPKQTDSLTCIVNDVNLKLEMLKDPSLSRCEYIPRNWDRYVQA